MRAVGRTARGGRRSMERDGGVPAGMISPGRIPGAKRGVEWADLDRTLKCGAGEIKLVFVSA